MLKWENRLYPKQDDCFDLSGACGRHAGAFSVAGEPSLAHYRPADPRNSKTAA